MDNTNGNVSGSSQDRHKDNYSHHQNDLIGRFANHKVAANLLMIMMIVAGIYGLSKLNRQFFPTFATDFISVRVVWPGASAEDVARSITTPLEQELKNLECLI